jgi:MerR family transcriptional regulator, aldehyde-responsive regulator
MKDKFTGEESNGSNGSGLNEGYTVQQTAELTGLSEHTLRYYERVGLIDAVERQHSSKHRRYSANDLAKLQTLACLRAAGMPLDQMRRYFKLMAKGEESAPQLQELLKEQRAALQKKMEQMNRTLDYVEHKIAYWKAIEEDDREKSEAILRELHTFLRGAESLSRV